MTHHPHPLRTTTTLTAAALAAALALGGCTPTPDTRNATTGQVRCDPTGFGPLSGCDTTTTTDTTTDTGSDSDAAASAEPRSGSACPDQYTVEYDPDTGAVIGGDPLSPACRAESDADDAQLDRALAAGPPARDWIVHDTHPLNPGRCLISLTGPRYPDGDILRFPTTTAECAQHQPGSTYHTGAAR